MIQFEQVSKSFGKQEVLSKLSFSVAEGEHLLITGTSGCGKSTLLRIVAGLEEISAGRVVLKNQEVTTGKKVVVQAEMRPVGLVPQDLGLWGNLSVRQNIFLGRKLDVVFYQDLLTRADLAGMERKKVGALSAGERQRVALVRALVARPEVLLLDEPFASLDLLKKREFYKAVKVLVAPECTLVTVTHDPVDWIGLKPDRVMVIERGGIIDDHRRGEKGSRFASKVLRVWREFGFSL